MNNSGVTLGLQRGELGGLLSLPYILLPSNYHGQDWLGLYIVFRQDHNLKFAATCQRHSPCIKWHPQLCPEGKFVHSFALVEKHPGYVILVQNTNASTLKGR